MLTDSTAVFAVKNVQETADYYRDVLGFKVSWLWETPPTFGCVSLGKVEIFLCEQPELAQKVEGHMHFFSVDEVDTLHAQHQAAGANILNPPENKPWGMREYVVRDPSGYHLRFAGPVKYVRPPTGADALSPHITVAPGTISLEDYVSMFESVNWNVNRDTMQKALSNTLLTVLATDTRTNQVVGITRSTGDGKYVMIWDVIVRPSHQGQKIGTALLETTLKELRARGVPPGTFVGLFTGKPDFYERVGFKKDGGMHLSL